VTFLQDTVLAACAVRYPALAARVARSESLPLFPATCTPFCMPGR
jgi:hypothetical protein